MRTIRFGCLVLCLGIIFCISGALAEPAAPEFDKIVQIQLKYDDGRYSLSSLDVMYGKAPNLKISSGDLTGTILDKNGNVLQSFSLQEPGRAYGDILGDPEGDSLVGYTEQATAGEMFITAPYVPDMQTFTLTDGRDGTVLVTADLGPSVATFCIDYSGDPDCMVLATPQKAATPDTSLSFLLATVFSASVLLAAGLAIMTIRRRSGITIPGAEPEPARQTVLVVDDDPDIVDVIQTFLTDKGCLTLKAGGGKECLELLKSQVPDLILLDVGMAPMDGWQTLEQIKKDPRTKGVPVLMLTGYKLTAMAARQYKICIDDYIQKPFQLDALETAIDNILERKKKLNESIIMVKKAGVDMDTFCELATLSRRISVNKRLASILQAPAAVPVMADMETLDEMSVADYLNVKTKDYEQRADVLRRQINASFRSKGLPDLTL